MLRYPREGGYGGDKDGLGPQKTTSFKGNFCFAIEITRVLSILHLESTYFPYGTYTGCRRVWLLLDGSNTKLSVA